MENKSNQLKPFLVIWNKLLHKFRIFFVSSWFNPVTAKEARLEDNLRNQLRDLIKSSTYQPPKTPGWVKYAASLRHDILTKDPRNFLNWSTYRSAMFYEPDELELRYLKRSQRWPLWQQILPESRVGNPRPYWAMKMTSGNFLHHAYIFDRYLNLVPDVKVSELDTVFEFGGGYGGLCRMLFKLGFAGNYYIFDLPETSLMQEYFLSSLGYSVSRHRLNRPQQIVFLDRPEDLGEFNTKQKTIDLFIATWSLSESPLAIRQKVFESIPEPKKFFIIYQGQFEGIDNREYFNQLMLTKNNYRWQVEKIEHLPDSYLLTGQRDN